MEDWWAEKVKQVYLGALAELDYKEESLLYGPAHIVWADSNFDTRSIKFCIDETYMVRWERLIGIPDNSTVRDSLKLLLAIPEAERNLPDPSCQED